MKPALFCDRDGVITELVYYPSHDEWEAPRKVDDLRFQSRAIDALLEMNRIGWPVFVITNQPSYAKGKCPLEDLQNVHAAVMNKLKNSGVRIAGAFVCYHHPESKVPDFGACECRKPSPFFILEAARDHDLDLANSWMAGDQDTDIETGRRAGCHTALIEYEHSAPKRGSREADIVCADLVELVRYLDR